MRRTCDIGKLQFFPFFAFWLRMSYFCNYCTHNSQPGNDPACWQANVVSTSGLRCTEVPCGSFLSTSQKMQILWCGTQSCCAQVASPASTSKGCFVSGALLKTKTTTVGGWLPHKGVAGGVSQRDWMEVWAFTSLHTVPSSPKPPQRLPGNVCFHLCHHCQNLGKHLPVLLQTDTHSAPTSLNSFCF